MPTSMFTGGNHICVATRDIDRAVRVWWDRYGVGPWRVFSYDAANMWATIDGRPTDFAMRAGLSQLGPHFRIEIIQPLDDRSPYAKSLAAHQGADHIHHVRLDVAEFDGALGRLRELGLRSLLDAQFKGGSADGPPVTGTYLATEDDLGFILEIADVPAGFSMPEPDYVYPAEA
jgi:methylmalonyl-CoA/ethylmalonyl-CoA epimerase